MQNEILRPVLETDEVAVPRYDVVGANGQVLQQNVELRLKNEVVQEGTPYDEESVLPNALVQQLGLPASATPADAFAAVIAKSGAKVSMNEPTAQDSVEAGYSIGASWIRPNYTLHNLAYSKAASDFVASACLVVKDGQTVTATGNGDDKVISVALEHGSGTGWLYCVVTPDATAVSAKVVAGTEEIALTVGEANVVKHKYSGTAVTFEVTFETANIASGSTVIIDNLTVIDEAATLEQVEADFRDVTDETVYGFITTHAPLNNYEVGSDSWYHIKDGVWRGGVSTYTGEEQLSDYTRNLYGLGVDGTPSDALDMLALTQGMYAFRVTVVATDGTPIPNVLLNGLLLSDRTTTAITDKFGVCKLALSTSQSPTVTINKYLGVVDKTVTLSLAEGYIVTPITITVDKNLSGLQLIQTSGVYSILPNQVVDICLVGGGASGSGYRDQANSSINGYGGGGGYVTNIMDVSFTTDDNEMTLTVGAGGSATPYDKTCHAGGQTTLVYKQTTASAAGASDRTGNGTGGAGGTNGTSGTVRVFNDSSLPLPGGGGGNGVFSGSAGYVGGADFGGNGAVNNSDLAAVAGRGPGGGGGGGTFYYQSGKEYFDPDLPPAAGGAGGMYIRFKGAST